MYSRFLCFVHDPLDFRALKIMVVYDIHYLSVPPVWPRDVQVKRARARVAVIPTDSPQKTQSRVISTFTAGGQQQKQLAWEWPDSWFNVLSWFLSLLFYLLALWFDNEWLKIAFETTGRWDCQLPVKKEADCVRFSGLDTGGGTKTIHALL